MNWASKGIHQGRLEDVVRTLFRGEYMETEARRGSEIVHPTTGACLELDVHLPLINLSFEFQDAYHYITTWDSQIPMHEVKFKDNYKSSEVVAKGATLVTVPCWWDGQVDSLVASIRFQRPDLLQQYKFKKGVLPISLNPDLAFFQPGTIPGVGELMQASFPSSSAQFARVMKLSNPWWMGEKYDGIRFCWHPLNQVIYTRSGVELEVPEAMIRRLDSIQCFLDGEAWFGRGFFQEAQTLISSTQNELIWPYLRMIAFDMPTPKFAWFDPVFEERYCQLLSYVPQSSPFVIIAHRVQCTRRGQLTNSIHRIIRDSGEGVILRRPSSIYEHERSTSLIKLKATRVDREALVVTNEENGAYTLQLPDGVKFVVPTKHFKTHIKCKKGDIVTFSYDRYAQNAVPVNARVHRIREDITWEFILSEYFKSVPKPQYLNEPTRKLVDTGTKSSGAWSDEKKQTMRKFFHRIAIAKNFDPLVAAGWYSLTKKYVKTLKGGSTVLDCFGGSYVKAVVHLFPEITFDITKFTFPPKYYWLDVQRRRKFFEDFAKDNKFDPLLACNWYSVTHEQIMAAKNAASVISYYRSNYKTALASLFPEIGLDRRFFHVPREHWEDWNNRRIFFLEYAKDNHFDPLNPANWYSVSADSIINYKQIGNYLLTTYYRGSYIEALQQLFPNIGIVPSKFTYVARKYWTHLNNRRKFFEDIAIENNFDPLISYNWYHLPSDKILQRKGSHSALHYYNGSTIKALIELFPETKFEESKFNNAPRNYWQNISNRKKFFLDVASSKGFDPLVPDNWYKLQSSSIHAFRGIHSLLAHYQGSLSKAVVHIFSELNLDYSKFIEGSSKYWLNAVNRKNFFLDFAAHKNFDPLVSCHWYSITEDELQKFANGNQVLQYFSGNFIYGLKQVFPDIKFEDYQFQALPHNYWQNKKNRRHFLEYFARSNSFDPQLPDTWYLINVCSMFLSHKWSHDILAFYNGNLKKALCDIFPEIGLVSTLIPKIYKSKITKKIYK